MEKLISDNELFIDMSREARANVVNRFDHMVVSKEWEHSFKRIIRNRLFHRHYFDVLLRKAINKLRLYLCK